MAEVNSIYGNTVKISGDPDSITLRVEMEESKVAVVLSLISALELGQALVREAKARIAALKKKP